MEVARLGDDKQFAILEQRRFKHCAVGPSPENDVIVGVALVVWCAHYVSVMRTYGKQDYPIAISARALRGITSCFRTGSHINLFPDP